MKCVHCKAKLNRKEYNGRYIMCKCGARTSGPFQPSKKERLKAIEEKLERLIELHTQRR
jgi:DNA-directed RNA polymerase subunit RPC12/RpoP